MLYLLDIDGTLIRSFIRDDPPTCADCGVQRGHEHRGNCPQFRGGETVYSVDEYDRVELLPRRDERIRLLAMRPGARFGLVTNQGGIAFGFQTVDQVWEKIGRVVAAFHGFYGRPVSIHVCAHHPKATNESWRCVGGDENWRRRKPEPGMLYEAINAHRVDPSVTWFVGDMESDRMAAMAAGVRYEPAAVFFR